MVVQFVPLGVTLRVYLGLYCECRPLSCTGLVPAIQGAEKKVFVINDCMPVLMRVVGDDNPQKGKTSLFVTLK